VRAWDDFFSKYVIINYTDFTSKYPLEYGDDQLKNTQYILRAI